MISYILAATAAVTLGTTSLETAPEVFRCAGHSHTCRGTGFSQQLIWDNLKEWSERNSVTAFGLGSPWSPENAKMAVYYEKEFRDRYYAGDVNPDYRFDAAEVQKTIDAANALGTKTIFYVDNETPKQRYGYLVVRCFGENDSDYLYKPQQMVRHCALTNPVWLRTDAFRAPAPIKTKRDHMANPKVRELMDYLAEGHFRKDYRVCTPGIVPVKAWRFDEMAKALAE